jgi:hypothetical protein
MDVAYYGEATVGKIEFVRLTTTKYGNGAKEPYGNGKNVEKLRPCRPRKTKTARNFLRAVLTTECFGKQKLQ